MRGGPQTDYEIPGREEEGDLNEANRPCLSVCLSAPKVTEKHNQNVQICFGAQITTNMWLAISPPEANLRYTTIISRPKRLKNAATMFK